MARDLIRLSGKEPDVEIRIEFTGMRAGEKLHEELMHDDENIVPTRYEEIMMLQHNGTQLARQLLDGGIVQLQEIALTRDANAIKTGLKQFVPEYEIQEEATVLDS
jgi:FlaA1/EpsC-like NDP-sugar epimerase